MNEEIQHDDLTDEELAFWLFVVYVLVIAPDCDEANQANED